MTLDWTTDRTREGEAVYTDHASRCGRFRLERGYGHRGEGWALLTRDDRGHLRWREDVRSVAGGKARAEQLAADPSAMENAA